MSKPMYVDLDFQNAARILQLPDPSSAQHPATKNYVDNALLGLGTPIGVKARTTANVTISTALNVGDSVDGVTLASGDLVLVDSQTTAAEDGIYVAGAVPARYAGLPVGEDARGLLVVVESGTASGGKLHMQTANPAIINTNGLTFIQFNAGTTYTADGQGIELTSTTFGLELDGTTLAKSASGVRMGDNVGVGLASTSGVHRVNAGLGITADGSSTRIDTSTVARWNTALGAASAGATIVQAHGFGHKELIVQVKLEATGKDITDGVEVACDTTNITVTFASSQADRSAFRLVWVG